MKEELTQFDSQVQKNHKNETAKPRFMVKLNLSPSSQRKARTRSLIQLGGLVEKTNLLDTFGLELGRDFQKDPEMKLPIAALTKGLLVLNELARSDEINLELWASQGLEHLKESNLKKQR